MLGSLGRNCRALGFRGRCAVITDSNVAPIFGGQVIESLRARGFEPALITVQAGERSKSLRVVTDVYHRLAEQRLERSSCVVALGGGVIGDLAGFAAATYLRGVHLVQVATTLVAQVDSSVGGKVGVNLSAGKNLVGAFFQPRLVICDLDTLRTLPEREFRSGLAEVIKYGVIHDTALFKLLERDLDRLLRREPGVLGPVVARCCAIKAKVVGQDETESGLRAILNFGHTIGHALEAVTGYRRLLHGEAIAIGQVAAAMLSARRNGLPAHEVERIKTLLARAGLPVSIRLGAGERERLFAAMRLDKKVTGGEVRFVLARRIGEVAWGQAVPDADLQAVLDELAHSA